MSCIGVLAVAVHDRWTAGTQTILITVARDVITAHGRFQMTMASHHKNANVGVAAAAKKSQHAQDRRRESPESLHAVQSRQIFFWMNRRLGCNS
jgi:hypothetical protein